MKPTQERRSLLVIAILMLSLFYFSCSDEKDGSSDYLNPSLSIEKRVEDLLSRMTLEEKDGQ